MIFPEGEKVIVWFDRDHSALEYLYFRGPQIRDVDAVEDLGARKRSILPDEGESPPDWYGIIPE